jgi:hypothetical protein
MLTTDRKLKKNANFLRWVKKNNGWISFCLKHLFDQHYHVPVEKKKRVRSGPRIKIRDCVELDQFSSQDNAMKHIALPSTAYEPN